MKFEIHKEGTYMLPGPISPALPLHAFKALESYIDCFKKYNLLDMAEDEKCILEVRYLPNHDGRLKIPFEIVSYKFEKVTKNN